MTEVDPVAPPRFVIDRGSKIATAGSCFAQHISRSLLQHGFNYYVAEQAPELAAEEARHRNYGVFSARFGNIYTARQLVQLFDRAYGAFDPGERHWVRSDGRFVDPYRPQIEADGYASPEALEASRAGHLSDVRRMFENLDVFIFTLGLTEAWRNKADGAVFPLAPGVAGGAFDPGLHEFVNFDVPEVVADLDRFIQQILKVNPRARIILTVSPVPLMATYEDRHVLVSTTYSKSVLRVAADAIRRRHANCEYFPSYEVISGNHTRGAYFDQDLRTVTPEGVEHVMRMFFAYYASGDAINADDHRLRELTSVSEIVCEEEAIDAVRVD